MKIFVYAYNKPEYLIPQFECLKKFIKEEFQLFCVDNSKEDKYTEQFLELCEKNNIEYKRNLKPDHSLEGTSHYAAMQWSWDTIISDTEEIIIMLDHDNFIIRKISIENLLGDNHIAGVGQDRGAVIYLNPAIMVFNTKTMPNKKTLSFNGGVINGERCDIGGELHYYLENKEVKTKFLSSTKVYQNDPILENFPQKYGYLNDFDFMEEAFLHPRNGSNWARQNDNSMKNRDKLIFEVLQSNLSKTNE